MLYIYWLRPTNIIYIDTQWEEKEKTAPFFFSSLCSLDRYYIEKKERKKGSYIISIQNNQNICLYLFTLFFIIIDQKKWREDHSVTIPVLSHSIISIDNIEWHIIYAVLNILYDNSCQYPVHQQYNIEILR